MSGEETVSVLFKKKKLLGVSGRKGRGEKDRNKGKTQLYCNFFGMSSTQR